MPGGYKLYRHMTGSQRQELRRIILSVFRIGVNKERMFNAVEIFIDENFTKQTSYIEKLSNEIKDAGGLPRWKKDLIKEFGLGRPE